MNRLKASPLKIVDFVNRRTGAISKRVTGTLPHPVQGVTDAHGRVQKNFSGPDALVKAQAFINEQVQQAARVVIPRPVITHLPESIIRQAEVAFARLPPGTDLVQAVDFFAEKRRPVVPSAMAAAIEDYGAWLITQRKNEEGTVNNRKDVLTHYANFATTVEGHPVGPITRTDRMTIAHAKAWIYSPDVSDRTQRDRYDWLNQFATWLVKQHKAATNVVTDLDRPVVKIDAPGVLTFSETWRLLMCALTDPEGPEMLPFFAVCVLSGVRPDEVPRLGARNADGTKTSGWEDVHLDDEHLISEVHKAKGGRSRRNAEICDPLWRILTWCKERQLAVNYFSKRKFDRIRRAAGLFDRWEKDLLRHTYASHYYILHKDIKTLTANMGNSERVLFQNYLRPVPKTDAVMFFGLALHWTAPRSKPVALIRMEKRLRVDPATLSETILRVTIARLASELWRLRKAATPHPITSPTEEFLARLRVELSSRIKNRQPNEGLAV